MNAQMMVQPSFWVSGIKISKVRNFNLFKFTDELQSRLEELSENKKAEILTTEEEAELAGIWELDKIFYFAECQNNCSVMTVNDTTRKLVPERAKNKFKDYINRVN